MHPLPGLPACERTPMWLLCRCQGDLARDARTWVRAPARACDCETTKALPQSPRGSLSFDQGPIIGAALSRSAASRRVRTEFGVPRRSCWTPDRRDDQPGFEEVQ